MPTIITWSGNLLDITTPDRASIDIDDIAHALANTCRWGGHCREFYSVAQHSVIVSQHVDPQHALHGLLHDAAEAYLGDIPRPIKQLLPEYAVAEKALQKEILCRLSIWTDCPDEVHIIDTRLMVTESIELGLRPQLWMQEIPVPLPVCIEPKTPQEAKKAFLARYNELCKLTPPSLRGGIEYGTI